MVSRTCDEIKGKTMKFKICLLLLVGCFFGCDDDEAGAAANTQDAGPTGLSAPNGRDATTNGLGNTPDVTNPNTGAGGIPIGPINPVGGSNVIGNPMGGASSGGAGGANENGAADPNGNAGGVIMGDCAMELACEMSGAKECFGQETSRTCARNPENGCIEWGNPQLCAVGQVCIEGECQDPGGAGGGGCNNECAPGQSQCAANGQVQLCGRDLDGCNVWVP